MLFLNSMAAFPPHPASAGRVDEELVACVDSELDLTGQKFRSRVPRAQKLILSALTGRSSGEAKGRIIAAALGQDRHFQRA